MYTHSNIHMQIYIHNMRAFAITYIMLSSFIHLSLHIHRLVIACRIDQKLSLAEKGWERKREREREKKKKGIQTYIYIYIYIYIYVCIYAYIH